MMSGHDLESWLCDDDRSSYDWTRRIWVHCPNWPESVEDYMIHITYRLHPRQLVSPNKILRSRSQIQFSRRFISYNQPKMGISNYASTDGEFRRKDSSFRNHIEVDGKFPPEKNRYHLYVSWACPWGNIPPICRQFDFLRYYPHCCPHT